MKTENKETELLDKIGKYVIKYLDYVFLFVTFPFIFDVRFADLKVFIALGSLIIIRAIMPGAQFLIKKKDEEEVTHSETYPEVKPEVKLSDLPKMEDIIYQSIIDSTNHQRTMMRFPNGLTGFSQLNIDDKDPSNQINIKKTEDGVIVSFSDFRTIRLKEKEMSHLYVALLESEYAFFKQGKWYLALTSKQH
jgi:hypothetical protein